MNIKVRSIFCGLVILLAACKKDSSVDNAANQTVTDLAVPTSFHWETSRDVSLSIGISDTRFQNKLHVVSVYLNDPINGGTPISKGSASLVSPFNTKISLPTTINEVYVVKTAPDGSSTTQKIALTSNNISVALSSVNNTQSVSLNPVMATITEADCGLTTSSSNNTSLNVSKNQVVCFTATNNLSLDVTANEGGTLKLNAPSKTITINNFNHTALNIVVSSNTTVVFNNNYELKSAEYIINRGTITFNGLKLAGNTVLQNDGTLTIKNNFETNSNSTIVNNLEFNVTANESKLDGTFTNNKAAIFQNLVLNGNAVVNNQCNLTVNNTFTVNNTLNNYSLVTVKGDTYVNGSGKINLYAGAMHLTATLNNMDGSIEGIGTSSPSLFKVTGRVDDKVKNNGGKLTGSVQFCSTTDIGTKHYSNGAVASCDLYIPITDCNATGNGKAPTPVVTKPDTDGDGIIDEQDAYPNDVNKAFNSYSVNYANGGSTIAFEDSWPLKGDYDLNDVVLNSKYLLVTNSNNIVVQISASYALKATGADYHNGTGIQFNLPAANAKVVTASEGIYLEGKQDSVVVMLFDDSRKEQATGNTEPGKTVSPVKNYSITFDVLGGPLLANFGIGTYNPFIWNNTAGFGRGYETHMFGKAPTKLANQKLFGTLDDKSEPGKYYTTANNLPWAIELPIANFGYLIERVEITKGYTKFAEWANSGGKLYPDWYTNSNFINSSYIYTK
ncbi:LruC domain-containing protein [Pedobacter duraquae]|uniref:LruC domain-containing protein n=1 Tax=Pedobacter duraquae TaxID=425511 RepID=A0A4R6IP48_9SPHI|nr:LruC domain-containing protein [Pedobacter duraquae]TDO24054.1 LruC domain-containing protein [Pedobacter duraquae]